MSIKRASVNIGYCFKIKLKKYKVNVMKKMEIFLKYNYRDRILRNFDDVINFEVNENGMLKMYYMMVISFFMFNKIDLQKRTVNQRG